MTESASCDVCVVGAGPAGLSAACTLADKGLSVVVVGKGRGGSRPAVCGETLSPSVSDVLVDLGLDRTFANLQLRAVSGFRSTWGSSHATWRPVSMMSRGGGWHLDRQAFERVLTDHATNKGIRHFDGAVEQIVRAGNRWRITGRAFVRPIVAHVVVNAAGRQGATPAARTRRVAIDKLISCMATIPNRDGDRDDTVMIDAVEAGWLYSARISDRWRVLMFFTDGDLLTARTEMQLVRHLQAVLQNAPCVSHTVSAQELGEAHGIKVVPCATLFGIDAQEDSWISCGDAAQTFDPLSSMGIAEAMGDAVDAAKSLASCLGGDGAALARHEIRRRRRFLEYLRRRLAYYAAESRWPNASFWSRRRNPMDIERFVSKFQGDARSVTGRPEESNLRRVDSPT